MRENWLHVHSAFVSARRCSSCLWKLSVSGGKGRERKDRERVRRGEGGGTGGVRS